MVVIITFSHDQVSLTSIFDSISREVLLAGTVLKHTFHGLRAGTGYTISVTAATDAGLGREATITATTVAMPQSLEGAVSVPSMYSMYGPCLCNAVNTVLYCTVLYVWV